MAALKTLLSNFLEDTTILLNVVKGKYGEDHKAYKLIEDVQEKVVERVPKMGKHSYTEMNECFIKYRDEVQDIIREYKL